MGTPLLQVGATVLCPHGGQASASASNPRVKVGGQPVLTASDAFTIAGCPFVLASSPHPCTRIQWTTPATRVRVGSRPVLLQASGGLCLAVDGVPQEPPNVAACQPRVRGT